MANHGVGTKFTSVNLNKSYGQPSHHHSSHSSSYASSRSRPNGHGGGGGGMVVLSRPRSSQKAGPKLSIPPPLNLPSLRKEHEKFDSLGLSGGPAGGGVSGSGSRPTSSGMGWTKPAAAALQEIKPTGEQTVDGFDNGLRPADGFNRGNSAYMPPSARSAAVGGSPATSAAAALAHPSGEKVAVLRGEDFPSLRATLSSGPPHKLKENLNPKHKQSVSENLSTEQKNGSRLTSHVDMHSQFHPSHGGVSNGLGEDGRETHSLRSSHAVDHDRKQEEYFLGPLPIVRLNPRSDWADDERDTSHGLTDRIREARDHGFSKNDAYWDRNFDLPRVSAMPHKPALNFDKWGQRDNETGKLSSSEVPKLNPVRASSREGREGNSWRNSTLSKEGFAVQGVANEKNGVGVRPSSMNREVGKDNKYISSTFQDNLHDDFRKREMRYGQKGRQSWNNTMESYGGRWPERNVRDSFAGNEQYNRYSSIPVQSPVSKFSSSVGAKGLPADDPLLNFNREKRTLPKSEKSFLEDPFMKDFGASGFDGRDFFSTSLVGMVKKKKEVPKQTDFHDPARESFEAEIEKVQRMQEQERQRNIEEHERALELARREEEERLRQIREQEERQRRFEEEAREAAWRAEQERIEALRKAEEQKIAREEEKHRILFEEERRKQAAKQKLLELEERIARRKADGAKVGNDSLAVADEKMSGIGEEKDAPRGTDVGDWDDSERAVEGIITSASSNSSSLNKSLETGSRPQFSRDSSSSFVDRGKPGNSWRRDVYENERNSIFYSHGQGNGPNSPSRDTPIGGKPLMRKEYDGGAGFMASRASNKGGIVDTHLDEYANEKGQSWNELGNGDHLNRNADIDSDFRDNLERFSDGWTSGRSRGNMFSAYPEHYPNSESDGSYAFGRSRYSVRQPRVLPPPSLTSVPKTYRDVNAHPNSAAVQENDMPTGYDDAYQQSSGQLEVVGALPDNQENEDRKVGSTTVPRCDSQSSLSVSSPPSSPTHLSHDDLEESVVSPAMLASVEGKNGPLSGQQNESVVASARAGNENVVSSSCAFSSGDDEEWTTENHEQFQEQEEYDEDENYQEEDEVHEGDDNVALNQEFENMNLEEKGLPHMMDNLVLGFDEGVQVGMLNDEFERTLKDETSFMAQASSGTLEEHVCFGNACSDGMTLQPVKSKAIDPSVFQDSEKTMQDLVIHSSKSQTSIVSDGLDNAAASNSDLSAHHSKLTSVTSAPYLSSDLSNMPNAASGPSQVELPVKLQFGLFTGPSLIPSPVPAIQIGSIQMPLHLHPQVGAPHSHMHPSQPPLFQFGQLRYTTPISQGMMPVGPQSMSFIQPSIQSEFSFNHNPGCPVPLQTGPDVIDGFVKSEIRSPAVDNQPSNLSHVNLSQGSLPSKGAENMAGINRSQTRILHDGESSTRTSTGFPMDEQVQQPFVAKSGGISSNTRDFRGQPHGREVSLHSASTEKGFEESKAHYPAAGRRGKRYAFVVKDSGSKSSGPATRLNHQETSGFQRRPRRNIQRTEFRVRVSGEKGLSSSLVSSDHLCSDSKSNINGTGTGTGTSAKTGTRKIFSNRAGKQAVESTCTSSATDLSQDVDSGGRVDKVDGKEPTKISGQSHLKRNVCSREEVDAPLQSGIIRVFVQPGIEAPSDEDDFIEVRSKRQMLNDRREQREKEIKAKSRVAKMPRKPRSASHGVEAKDNCGRGTLPIIEASNNSHSDFVVPDGNGLQKSEMPSGSVSQPLAPIGTPPLKIDAQPDLRSETSRSLQMSLPAVSGGGKNPGAGVIFESKNKVQTSLGNAQTSQQVMALTQRQLDEAMKPQQFDSQASGGDLTVNFSKPSLPTSSILMREKPFSPVASPINSLLAGEKIQFGAVTSPTVLPPSSRALSHGIGPSCSSMSNMQISHNPAGADHDCSLFYDKEKQSNGSHDNLEDCEAEAEAAASAVAVAAISSDDIAVNGLGTSISVSEARSYGAADIDGIAAGVASNQQSASKARSEEPLSLSLPADLSVETPPISLWPPLPTLQSSSQMLSHFPGGHPPHFPFYEMNPMMGGPVFAFGPHDEAASTTPSQSQKSSMQASGPISSWQHCHSGIDSFYGPAAGFTGPFIAPPRGIPGVQGPPPHMVVYNHFAPVGQFGQVGLSFMGATYIPSGKQSDWKHNSTSSATGASEGDMNNINMAPSQRNPVNITAPIQHLAPGSPLVPMASPLAMFDISPFQSSPEMSVQARWPHAPNSPLSSIPLSMPLQEGAHTSQYSHGPSVDQPMSVDRFPTSQTSAPSDGDRNFPTGAGVNFNRLPDELGLVDPSNSSVAKQSALSSVIKTPSVSIIADAAKVDVQSGNGSNSNSQNGAAFKSQPLEKNNTSQQYDHSSGYTNYQRSVSHKNSSGGEWSTRRMGLQGRNQTLGADKSFSTSKVKQIYVAKQTTSGASAS